jgi:hypothetical protein
VVNLDAATERSLNALDADPVLGLVHNLVMAATVRLRVLGPVSVEGATVVDGLRPAHRRLLSILAIEPGAAITVDELIDRFWPDRPPMTAKRSHPTAG